MKKKLFSREAMLGYAIAAISYSIAYGVHILISWRMDYNAAELYLIKYLKSKGCKISGNEVKDFNLHGDESVGEIEGYADDHLSELASDEAEYRQHRKDMGYEDDTEALDRNLYY